MVAELPKERAAEKPPCASQWAFGRKAIKRGIDAQDIIAEALAQCLKKGGQK
jgi:hypothetical protein